ncbi:MAG: DUF1015 domain-containing protein [Gemmatimonadales bacterium]
MAAIFPTAAIHYTAAAGDPSQLISPPYDVIDTEEARHLRDLSPFNAVRLVLPEGGAPERYRLASDRMSEWLASGILARAHRDEIYSYTQEFSYRGRPVVRHAALAAVGLATFETGEVLPHERTHRGPKEDRLALMKACEAQLSPIFFIARDSERQLPELLAQAGSVPPMIKATSEDGITHIVRVVPREQQNEILAVVAADDLLIADGHHRYETALELARQRPDRDGARRVLAAIVSEHDDGLIVRATHRRLGGLPPDWHSRLPDSFEIEAGPEDPQALAEEVRKLGGSAIGVCWASRQAPAEAGRRGLVLQARPTAVAHAGLTPNEAALACVLFDRLILRRYTGQEADAASAAGLLSYHQDPATAAEPAPDAAAFLLPPVSMPSLWAVVREGGRLPPKSTYFTPKMPSGLLFRPI